MNPACGGIFLFKGIPVSKFRFQIPSDLGNQRSEHCLLATEHISCPIQKIYSRNLGILLGLTL